MPDLLTDERRPADHEAPSQVLDLTASSLPHGVEVRQDDDTSPHALVLAGVARRRVFFGLPAAEKAVARARARGEVGAHLELVRLQLVATIGGGAHG